MKWIDKRVAPKMEIYVGQWKHLVEGIKIFTHMEKEVTKEYSGWWRIKEREKGCHRNDVRNIAECMSWKYFRATEFIYYFLLSSLSSSDRKLWMMRSLCERFQYFGLVYEAYNMCVYIKYMRCVYGTHVYLQCVRHYLFLFFCCRPLFPSYFACFAFFVWLFYSIQSNCYCVYATAHNSCVFPSKQKHYRKYKCVYSG